MEVMIKYRLFHYYEEKEVGDGTGRIVLIEKMARFGQVVDIPRDEDIDRGEELDAFYTDEEREAIESGAFRGPSWQELRSNAGTMEASPEAAAAGEPLAEDADAETIADHILENKLTVPQTVELAGNDPEKAKLVLEAESMVAESREADMRSGVESGLQAVIEANQ